MTEGSEGPGQVLRAEREALGVTTRDVAETLNLSVSMVEAIEADDYERMPAAVFARGYIRAYARLLDLEPEPIVARFPDTAGGSDVRERVTPPGWKERLRRHPQVVIAGVVVLALLLLLGLGLLLWPSQPPANQTTAEPVSRAPAGDDGSGPTSPAEPAQVSTDDAGSAEVEIADSGSAPAALAAESPAAPAGLAQAEGPMPDVPETGSERARRITEAGDDQLRFAFSEDCWVEVRSATGRNLFSDLGRSGSTLSLVGEGPFRILLGYAPGAEVAFNGEQVALAPHTRNNVATLVLGQ